MTRYIETTGWDNAKSTPLEDIRETVRRLANSSNYVQDFKWEIDKWKKEVGGKFGIPHPTKVYVRSDSTDDELRAIGDYFEKVLGWRPAEVFWFDGYRIAMPQRSQSARRLSGRM